MNKFFLLLIFVSFNLKSSYYRSFGDELGFIISPVVSPRIEPGANNVEAEVCSVQTKNASVQTKNVSVQADDKACKDHWPILNNNLNKQIKELEKKNDELAGENDELLKKISAFQNGNAVLVAANLNLQSQIDNLKAANSYKPRKRRGHYDISKRTKVREEEGCTCREALQIIRKREEIMNERKCSAEEAENIERKLRSAVDLAQKKVIKKYFNGSSGDVGGDGGYVKRARVGDLPDV